MAAVSVIIPTYNCSRFLVESLESVFAQSEPPMEVIVVDDGSTDDTQDILARYRDRLIVVQGEHGGLSDARNRGLARARGDLVAFHDADDVACSDRLSFQLSFLRQNPGYDAVFCNGERMDTGESAKNRLVPPKIARRLERKLITAADLFEGYPVYFQGALVPRRSFARAGGLDVTLRVQPDIEYAYRLLAHMRATFVDRVVFLYRWHTTNNSADRLGGREDIARILEGLESNDPQIVRLIGRRRLTLRLARHYYRIARMHLTIGNIAKADAAATRAVDLQPLNPRYQLLRLWHLRRASVAARVEAPSTSRATGPSAEPVRTDASSAHPRSMRGDASRPCP